MSRGTQDTPRGNLNFAYTAITFFGYLFRGILLPKLLPHKRSLSLRDWSPTTPLIAPCGATWGLGSSVFAHRYLRNTNNVSFPSGTKMFQFPEFPHPPEAGVNRVATAWVSPFGNHRFTGYWLLTGDYRGQLRPSSATSPKAFTVRVLYLTILRLRSGLILSSIEWTKYIRQHFSIFVLSSIECTKNPSSFSSLVKVPASPDASQGGPVDLTGIEPVTSSLQMMRSYQLSYRPENKNWLQEPVFFTRSYHFNLRAIPPTAGRTTLLKM